MISLVAAACAYGEQERKVVSYYVSKVHAQVRFARLISADQNDLDSNEALEVMSEMLALEGVPFKSRFLEKGHELLEVSHLFDPLIPIGAPGFQAGQNHDYRGESSEQAVELDIEPQVGVSDEIIDLRLAGKIRIGLEEVTEFKTGLTLRSGEPMIFSKTRVEDKWRALAIRAEFRGALAELPE